MSSKARLVAMWRSRGRDVISLWHNEFGYYYEGNDQAGSIPLLPSDEKAIEWMERPWGQGGAGPVYVLRTDKPSTYRVKR